MNNPLIFVGHEATSQLSASDRVFFAIMRDLEMRRVSPGQRLVEVDLCERFGVARTTVREAIQRLVTSGIVQITRHRGASIRVLSRQEAMELLDVAEVIISLLVCTAARNVRRNDATKVIRASLAELSKVTKAHDGFVSTGLCRHNFYRALHCASGNLELRRISNQIHLDIFHAQLPPGALDHLRLEDYREIVKSVLAEDENGALKAWRNHVARVRKEATKTMGSGASN